MYYLIFVKVNQYFQKQPLRDVFKKTFSKNMQQIYKRTPMSKRDFNKVASTAASGF